MLFRDDKKSIYLNANRYTDHRREENPGTLDARVSSNVTKAIESLDPSKHSIQETYKRIMARNRPAEEGRPDMDGSATGDNSPNDG